MKRFDQPLEGKQCHGDLLQVHLLYKWIFQTWAWKCKEYPWKEYQCIIYSYPMYNHSHITYGKISYTTKNLNGSLSLHTLTNTVSSFIKWCSFVKYCVSIIISRIIFLILQVSEGALVSDRIYSNCPDFFQKLLEIIKFYSFFTIFQRGAIISFIGKNKADFRFNL